MYTQEEGQEATIEPQKLTLTLPKNETDKSNAFFLLIKLRLESLYYS